MIGLNSCDPDNISEDALYTFTDQMMGQFLADTANASQFSEFSRLLDTTKVDGLLNAYGVYTCFAPTNAAFNAYYALKGVNDMSDFSIETLKMIAYDHLIQGSEISAVYFAATLSDLTMNDKYVTMDFSEEGTIIYKASKVLQKDIMVHNGVIHSISSVLDPNRESLTTSISKDTVFSIFYSALVATHLGDSLLKEKDNDYDWTTAASREVVAKEDGNWFYDIIPRERYFGYTALIESDATYAKYGITDLNGLIAYAKNVYDEVYPEDASITDPTNRKNSLNRFVAYHLMNKKLTSSKFVDDYDTDHMVKTLDIQEYIETMCPNTLIEVYKLRGVSADQSNFFNFISKDINTGLKLVPEKKNNVTGNGVYHEISDMLVYNKEVDNYISTKRLRFEAASFFPELTNNNMRGAQYPSLSKGDYSQMDPSVVWKIPANYIERLKTSEQTSVDYLSGYPAFADYMGDEIFLAAAPGRLYDFEMETLPVPAGTYEVRFGYQPTYRRGVAQLYLDDKPCGVPLNLNNDGLNDQIGWELVSAANLDDPYGYENDKMMRNRGYMKAPDQFFAPNHQWYKGVTARVDVKCLRKILGVYTFDKAGTHMFKVKGLSAGEFMFDYLEFVPISVIETEDIH